MSPEDPVEPKRPRAGQARRAAGEIQQLIPSIDALYVPNIDEALDEEAANRAFWTALRVLGAWYADFPPS